MVADLVKELGYFACFNGGVVEEYTTCGRRQQRNLNEGGAPFWLGQRFVCRLEALRPGTQLLAQTTEFLREFFQLLLGLIRQLRWIRRVGDQLQHLIDELVELLLLVGVERGRRHLRLERSQLVGIAPHEQR